MLTTREVAQYLRIKERKVYDMVRDKTIPCTRVTGKWLFPKVLIDAWLAEGTWSGPAGTVPQAQAQAPRVICGSHDPLLEWSLRESGSELAMLSGGSLDGLARFAAGQAVIAGLHVLDGGTGDYNRPAVQQAAAGLPVVLIQWAWRQQGLVVAAGNPRGIQSIADLEGKKVAVRQRQAGSRILFDHLVAGAGLKPAGLDLLDPPLRSETDLGLAVFEGKAHAGLAVAAVARQYKLDFVPLTRERYDLLIRRRDYFDQPFQKLLAFARTPAFQARAREMEGYDVSHTGKVEFNS